MGRSVPAGTNGLAEAPMPNTEAFSKVSLRHRHRLSAWQEVAWGACLGCIPWVLIMLLLGVYDPLLSAALAASMLFGGVIAGLYAGSRRAGSIPWQEMPKWGEAAQATCQPGPSNPDDEKLTVLPFPASGSSAFQVPTRAVPK